ncbi:zinc finger protein 714-like isoform X2 [Leptidea sinapis]|uniref:zinc finger protein 714-like isoform X2 n=1 Tax=Leptidea sinapis TaxID=189913 RepID=UPI0021C3732D|nr:zinc finger protein 714-like isoform X2 [Leptidea sinapis]
MYKSINIEEYTYEYFTQEDVCRFCWNKNAITELFNQECSIESLELKDTLINKVKECLNIDITLVYTPSKACDQCCDKIESFYYFKRFCQETDKKLQDIINHRHKVQLEDNFIKNEVDFDVNIGIKDSDEENDSEKNELESKSSRYKPKRTPTYCNICCEDFKNLETLDKHKSESHGIEKGLFKCFGCDKTFKTGKSRLGHETRFCKNLKYGYECIQCNKFLRRRRNYEQHMKDHRNNVMRDIPENIFKCLHCFDSFKNTDDLREHMNCHENAKKIYSCGRAFGRQDYLAKHMLTHSGDKRYSCTYCSFRAAQRSALTVHIRKHTGERPYSCDLCPQKCISSSNLRAHRKIHLGLRQYECSLCEKKFGYKASLEEHVASTHASCEKHSCKLCGATYSRGRTLRRHMADKHGDRDAVK